MDLRHWLAGAAAATLVGTAPVSAQAPRSLFEELPSPGSAPVTMGMQASVPTRADRFVPELKPTQAPDTPASLAPTVAGSEKPQSTGRAEKRRPEKRRLAARVDPAQAPIETPLTAAPTVPAETPAASTPAAEAAPAKPMTRAERRRARLDAKRQAAAAAAAPEVAPAPAPPVFATNPFQTLFGALPAQERGERLPPLAGRGQIDALVSRHARLNNVPEALVHRVIVRESKYNPRAVGRGGAMGLMQIKTATARGVGYPGGPAGLLDAETNLTYGVKYLAGAWRVAGGSHDRAVSNYARGYYYEAKRQGLAGPIGRRGRRQAEPETTASAAVPQPFFSIFSQQASNQ